MRLYIVGLVETSLFTGWHQNMSLYGLAHMVTSLDKNLNFAPGAHQASVYHNLFALFAFRLGFDHTSGYGRLQAI